MSCGRAPGAEGGDKWTVVASWQLTHHVTEVFGGWDKGHRVLGAGKDKPFALLTEESQDGLDCKDLEEVTLGHVPWAQVAPNLIQPGLDIPQELI